MHDLHYEFSFRTRFHALRDLMTRAAGKQFQLVPLIDALELHVRKLCTHVSHEILKCPDPAGKAENSWITVQIS